MTPKINEEELIENETLKDLINGFMQQIDNKELQMLIGKAQEKWINQGKTQMANEIIKKIQSRLYIFFTDDWNKYFGGLFDEKKVAWCFQNRNVTELNAIINEVIEQEISKLIRGENGA